MKAEIKNFATKIFNGAKEHSPEICTAIGIAGMYTAIILAVKATPKAMERIEAKKKETGKEKLSVGETIKTAGPCYIGTGIAAVGATTAFIFSTKESLSRNAVLASLLAVKESDLKLMKEKTEEIVGPKKEKEIEAAVATEKERKTKDTEVIFTGKGDVTVIDAMSMRRFKSDPDFLKRMANELNAELFRSMYASLNEFYDLINLERTKAGDMLGWRAEDAPIFPVFTAIKDEDDRPIIIMDFNVCPQYEFRTLN